MAEADQHRGSGVPGGRWAVLAGLHLLGLAVTLLAVTRAYDGAHNGRAAGNEAMAVAAALGLHGLLMVLVERRFSHRYLRLGARAVLAVALLYLAVGAIMGNARWADGLMRFLGYGAVLGAVWLGDFLLRGRDLEHDVDGIAALVATGVGIGICRFEVVRLLEPAFTLPAGQVLTPTILAVQNSVLALWTAGVLALYGTVAMVAGRLVQSVPTRLLAAGTLGAALLYAAAGTASLAAGATLRISAMLAVTAGWAASWLVARGAMGVRNPPERIAMAALLAAGAGVTLLWIGREVLG